MTQQLTQTQTAPTIETELPAFLGKIMQDVAGGYVALAAGIGDRLGLFKTLATQGPSTPKGLSEAAGIDERYAQEWLNAMLSGGYVSYDPQSSKYVLPQAQAMVLAQEGGPAFLASVFTQFAEVAKLVDRVQESIQTGQGVSAAEHSATFYQAMERTTANWIDHQLVQVWVPAVPGLADQLQTGIRVADIGSGGGRAVIALAKAFPKSKFTGFDVDKAAVARARIQAERAGVASRVSFRRVDATTELPGTYDVILCLDTLHDMSQPEAALALMRDALAPGGRILLLELNAHERPEKNMGAWGGILYGGSLFYCLGVSRAQGGHGSGSAGMPPARVRALCRDLGLAEPVTAAIQNPYNNLFVLSKEA